MTQRARIFGPDIEDPVRAMLIDLGHEVVVDPDGGCDLVLLDLDEAGEIAPRVAETRARLRDCPVLVYSSLNEPRAVAAAIRAGAQDWVPKSSGAREVGECVAAALLRSQLDRERRGLVDFLEQHGREVDDDRRLLKDRVASMAAELTRAHGQLEQAHRQLRGRVSQLAMLYRIGHDLSSQPNWDEALSSFLQTLCRFLNAQGAALYLCSDAGRRVSARSQRGLSEETLERVRARITERLARGESDDALLSLDAEDHLRSVDEEGAGWGDTLIPLRSFDRQLGYLLLRKDYGDRSSFEEDYYFLVTIQTVLAEEVSSAQAMSELRKLKDFHERTFDHVSSGIFTVDAEGRIQFANRTARELFGTDPHELSVSEFLDLGAEAPSIHTWMNGVIAGGTRPVDGWLCGPTHHEAIPVTLVGSPLPAELPGEVHVVCVMEDQRQRHALELERRRAARQKEHLIMAAEWAHDVRTPLTGILHSAELLAEALDPASPKRRHFEVVQSEVRRINELVCNFLDYARPAELRTRRLTAGAFVGEVVELLRGPARDRGHDLGVEVDDAARTCVVEADGDALKQVLLNLVQNALDASPPEAPVTIRATAVDHEPELAGRAGLQLEVRDRGPGVPEDHRERLFIPFFTTKAQGTGLGLAISEKIVRAHEGHLRYVREDEHTVMKITLPAVGEGIARTGSERRADRGTESTLEAKG